MVGKASAKFVQIAPFKLRRVAVAIQKKPVREGLAILDVLPHRGSKILSKLIRSAVSNLLQVEKNIDEDMLYVQQCYVNEGPRVKRMWPRARGKADVILKRMSHVTAVVAPISEKESK